MTNKTYEHVQEFIAESCLVRGVLCQFVQENVSVINCALLLNIDFAVSYSFVNELTNELMADSHGFPTLRIPVDVSQTTKTKSHGAGILSIVESLSKLFTIRSTNLLWIQRFCRPAKQELGGTI